MIYIISESEKASIPVTQILEKEGVESAITAMYLHPASKEEADLEISRIAGEIRRSSVAISKDGKMTPEAKKIAEEYIKRMK